MPLFEVTLEPLESGVSAFAGGLQANEFSIAGHELPFKICR